MKIFEGKKKEKRKCDYSVDFSSGGKEKKFWENIFFEENFQIFKAKFLKVEE